MATIPLSAQRMLVALRQMNRDEGISQIDLAAKVGVSQGRISDYLRGDPPKQDKVERFAASFRIRPEFFADPELGDAPNYRDFVGRGPSVVDRDDTKGAPAVESFIEARAELGMPLPEEAIRSLRSTFYKTAEIDTTLVEHAYSSWAARQKGKAIERPSVGGKIDEAKGQRRLEPVKKRR